MTPFTIELIIHKITKCGFSAVPEMLWFKNASFTTFDLV